MSARGFQCWRGRSPADGRKFGPLASSPSTNGSDKSRRGPNTLTWSPWPWVPMLSKGGGIASHGCHRVVRTNGRHKIQFPLFFRRLLSIPLPVRLSWSNRLTTTVRTYIQRFGASACLLDNDNSRRMERVNRQTDGPTACHWRRSTDGIVRRRAHKLVHLLLVSDSNSFFYRPSPFLRDLNEYSSGQHDSCTNTDAGIACRPICSMYQYTPIVNWMLHIMMPLDSYCKNLDGAVRLNILWPIMCLNLLLIFVNWCILCGDTWMLRTMFSLVLHYALIFSLDLLFLEGGVIFSSNL